MLFDIILLGLTGSVDESATHGQIVILHFSKGFAYEWLVHFTYKRSEEPNRNIAPQKYGVACLNLVLFHRLFHVFVKEPKEEWNTQTKCIV